MVGVAFGEVEFGQDAADVFFDGAFGDVDLAGDAGVGGAFGHQGQDLVFAGGEQVEGVAAAAGGDEFGDQGGVDDGGAGDE